MSAAVLVALPMLGALAAGLVRGRAARTTFAAVVAATTLALVVGMALGAFPPAVRAPWFPGLGVSFSLGFDGASLLLALVTAFMTLVGIVYAGQRDDIDQGGAFLPLVLATEAGILGILGARDLILFYVFFEGTLVPSLFMLGLFGRADRRRAATSFALYTVAGGLVMLAAILAARFLSGAPSFDLAEVAAATRGLPLDAQTWLLLGFLAAFTIKLPVFPLHGWLPAFHEQNHPSGVADVMGTLYKIGGYGLFRFALPMFPDAALELRPYLMALAAFTAVYGAWVGFAQEGWKRLLAYGSLSHQGLVALGLFSLQPAGIAGALYLLAFQGVYTGGLFLATGMLEARLARLEHASDRARALEIGRFRGLAASAPALAGATLTLWFASIGVPGLAGFIGEFGVFIGAYTASPWTAAAALLTVVASAAMALFAYQRAWHERPNPDQGIPDVRGPEWLVLAPVLAAVAVFGLYTSPALNLLQPSVSSVLNVLGAPR